MRGAIAHALLREAGHREGEAFACVKCPGAAAEFGR